MSVTRSLSTRDRRSPFSPKRILAASLSLTLTATLLLADPPATSQPASAPAPDRRLFVIATAHLDTQWLWTIQDSIREYVPNTLNHNFDRFQKYPNYVFNFEGAFRYMLAKEYEPAAYAKLRNYVAAGRWNVTGSSIDAGDVNLPSPEALIRLILLGNRYFRVEFGKQSRDIFLPDCFGFGYALPSVAAHCGLRGFSTQKLTWGSSIGIPFDVGLWQGVDGATLLAALNPGDYVSKIREDLSRSPDWLKRIDALGEKTGAYVGFKYFGTGDQGGAPDDESVAWLEKSIASDGPIKTISASPDQFFSSFTPDQIAKLPRHDGEMLMTRHGTGCYTCMAIMKRWNRKNEQLADAAERAAVVADWLKTADYPRRALRDAWTRHLWHHHHDDLTGTSIPEAYTFSANDELICLNQFADILTRSAGATARALDTHTRGIPLVVFNPLSIDREDVLEATVRFNGPAPEHVQVTAPDGTIAPSQILARADNELKLLILARAPSVGYSVYDVSPAKPQAPAPSSLRATPTELENPRYLLKLDPNGDIASIHDKTADRELLLAPIRLQMLEDAPDQWPEWEVRFEDLSTPPREHVSGPLTARITESGPVRATLELTRESGGSLFIQRIRLASGGAADTITIDHHIVWKSPHTLLKAAFPLAVSNPKATYDLGLGVIQRGNNSPTLYEVPAQQWADLTNLDGSYGVSILNDCKYGWDKPDDRTLRLSLIHSPHQIEKDMGTHHFTFALAGHSGNWQHGDTPWQAARLNQKLIAFQAPKHPGTLGKNWSFARVSSPQVAVRALKCAEDGLEIILRLQELHGRPIDNLRITFPRSITSAHDFNGAEEPLKTAPQFNNDALILDFKPFQPRTIALRLAPSPVILPPQKTVPLPLPNNTDVIAAPAEIAGGAFDKLGRSIPSDLIPRALDSAGASFVLTSTKQSKATHAVACRGQTLNIPKDAPRRLYLLAAADEDTDTLFTVGDRPLPMRIHAFTGFIGQWHSLVREGQSLDAATLAEPFQKTAPIAWLATHRLDSKGRPEPYLYCQLYRYRIDLPPDVSTVKLPSDDRVKILSAVLCANPSDDVRPAVDLYEHILMPRILPRQTLTIAPIEITLSTDDPLAELRYTTDDSLPTRDSPPYAGPFTIEKTTTIKARAFKGVRDFDFIADRTYRFVTPTPALKLADSKPGLRFTYYEGPFTKALDLPNQKPISDGTLPRIQIPESARPHEIGLVFSGLIEAPKDGVYTFYLKSDDGSTLHIGDDMIINNDGLHGPVERRGSIALAAGLHPIELRYFQRWGDATLELTWDGPGLTRRPIAPEQLRHPPPAKVSDH